MITIIIPLPVIEKFGLFDVIAVAYRLIGQQTIITLAVTRSLLLGFLALLAFE